MQADLSPIPETPAAEQARCPICLQSATIALNGYEWQLQRQDSRTFRYAECRSCRLMFAVPLPSEEELEWLYTYGYDYSWFLRRRHLKRMQASHRYRRLRDLLPAVFERGRGRLLDVGCGHGWFLEAAHADGWRAEGLEMLSDRAELGGDVVIHNGTLANHTLPASAYDLVTLWHVLEHMNRPGEALAAVRELLAPGGICVIAVPNKDAAGLRRAKERWVWCQPPYTHPWHFTEGSLKSILPAGLQPFLATSRDTWDAQYFETMLPFRGALRAAQLAWQSCGAVAQVLGLKAPKRWCDSALFITEEAVRLISYAGYLGLRPFLRRSYEHALRGSELMLILRREE
jgi:SAM-dependent methyltransferase